MSEVSTIGLDLAKNVFQVHGANASGAVVFRKRLRREGVLKFLAAQPACTVAMEACASSHHWGREITKLGHEVRLIAPDYVKPFVKRQKNDAADAEAICEATQRPTMRFVAVKGEEQQAAAVVFRARDLFVRQRTQIFNAIRGHLAEFGMVVAKGPFHVAKLVAAIEDSHAGVPPMVRPILRLLADQLRSLDERVVMLDRELARRAREDEEAKRLMTIPGIGPITATALVALAPAAQAFKRGRDFAAWLGLTPPAALHGREAEARRDLPHGRTNLAPTADHRSERDRALGNAQGLDHTAVACAHAESQAAHAGDRRPRQQDGAHRLGIDGERRNLSGSGDGEVGPPPVLKV
jgi:transposase